jgi:FAD synthase
VPEDLVQFHHDQISAELRRTLGETNDIGEHNSNVGKPLELCPKVGDGDFRRRV